MAAKTHEEAVKLLHIWQYSSRADNFTSLLFCMFAKADRDNYYRLKSAFPLEAAAYEEWMQSPTQQEFFEKYGLPTYTNYNRRRDARSSDTSL